MSMHIIIADAIVGASRQYISSSKRGGLTGDINDAARFASEAAALDAVRKLLTNDFERTKGVTLLLGTVTVTVATTKPVPRKVPAKGFVIRRRSGDYYKGPKTRPPRDFRDAHYGFIVNRDAATVFPLQEVAQTYGEACRAILRKVAADEQLSRTPGSTYQRIADEFEFIVEAV